LCGSLERGERENREEKGGEKGGEGVLSRIKGCAEQTCNSDVSKRQKKQKADPQSKGTWTSNQGGIKRQGALLSPMVAQNFLTDLSPDFSKVE
jgi:hypothetical protein